MQRLAFVLLVVPAVALAAPVRVPSPDDVERHETLHARAYPTAGEAWALVRSLRAAERVIGDLEKSRALFDRPSEQGLTADEKSGVLALWATLLEYEVAFDAVKDRFRDSWLKAHGDNAECRAFVVAYAAYVGQLRASMAIVEATAGKAAYEKLLNEDHPEIGIGGGHLDRLKAHALTPKAAVVLRAGHDYLGTLDKRLGEAGVLEEGPFKELVRHAGEAWAKTDKIYWAQGFKLFATVNAGFAKSDAMAAVFPVQKGIATWMGDTRYRHQGQSLIKEKQLEAMRARMEPGDIIFERRNWYLSNVGLPGFWPHAELYSADPAAFRSYFDEDPEVRRLWPRGFTTYLAETYAQAWKSFTAAAPDGKVRRVIEAVSEGVVMSSLEEAAMADYIGVLRPRLTRVEKARAFVRAFANFGKPYDFDFDFLTDATLVCSELVYKAYQATRSEGRSLAVPLVQVAGRTTLPPSEFIKRWDLDYGTDREQFEFVAFLDGREKSRNAVEATEADLRATWKRSKWDLSQQ